MEATCSTLLFVLALRWFKAISASFVEVELHSTQLKYLRPSANYESLLIGISTVYTYPSDICIFVVGIDDTVPLVTEREPIREWKQLCYTYCMCNYYSTNFHDAFVICHPYMKDILRYMWFAIFIRHIGKRCWVWEDEFRLFRCFVDLLCVVEFVE